jgi:hypothetical protein
MTHPVRTTAVLLVGVLAALSLGYAAQASLGAALRK